MKRNFWLRIRANRLVFILVSVAVYIALAFIDAKQTFLHAATVHPFILPTWLSFGFSLSVALIFLAVGSLVWFYSQDRQVSFLLFLFSCSTMVAFELETATSTELVSNHLLNTLSGVATSLVQPH